jgi:outer membrane protein OmpA-like peptidoglycan-associated protein
MTAEGLEHEPVMEGRRELLPISGDGDGEPRLDGETETAVSSLQGGGIPLGESERSFFEPRFGADFSRVRLHTGPAAEETARSLHAQAFTVGHHIAFGAARYTTGTDEGMRLLAHELAHVVQQGGVPAVTLRRTPDVDDPTRFTQVNEALFVNTPSGGILRSWVNPDPVNGVAGTAEEIKNQFITALRAHIAANPLSVGGTVPTRTTESQAETTAIAVDQDIRSTFPHITTPIPETQIRSAVAIIQTSQTSDPQFLNQWLENRLSLMTDIDEFNIRTTDPRYEQMLADILADTWAAPNVRTLASRQAAFIEAGTRISLHHGTPADLRRLILIHELTHFYTHQGFRDWVDATTAPRFYTEGFTEYLARMVMTPQERSTRTNYEANLQAIQDKVAAFVPDDDIARAYFLGEVWRLEATSAVARQLFESQVGMREGAPRSTEVAESQSSHGIVQIVEEGNRYRFMNLAVNQASPKPEHVTFFQEIRQRHLDGHPDVQIRFVGHADETGGAPHNLDLSRHRVESFYRMARDAGVPDSQLIDAATPLHRGEAEPTAENSSIQGRALNRRVELFLIRSGVTAPSP